MVATPSTMVQLGTKARPFSLPDPQTGKVFEFIPSSKQQGSLIVFICNHCPYVLHLLPVLVDLCNQWQERGLKVIFISSNDVENYPADSPNLMAKLAQQYGFAFPYLYDEDQTVAFAYRAACTPDFFLYNSENSLYYRGQFDASRPGNEQAVNGNELAGAVARLFAKLPAPETQHPSLGCNLKWKKGNEPDYFIPRL
ncbi:MAG: thioredoxin family protein [Opitutae bacterium]